MFDTIKDTKQRKLERLRNVNERFVWVVTLNSDKIVYGNIKERELGLNEIRSVLDELKSIYDEIACL